MIGSSSTPLSNQHARTLDNKTDSNRKAPAADEKINYTDLVFQLMKDSSNLQTNELEAARGQIEIVKNRIEEFREKLKEQRKLLAEQARRRDEAAQRDDIFGAIADAFTIMAAAIAVALAPNPLTIALLVVAVTQVVLQRTDAIFHLAKAAGNSDEDASNAQLGVSISLAVLGVVGGVAGIKAVGGAATAALKAAETSTKAADAAVKMARFKTIIQAVVTATSGMFQAGKGGTTTELSVVEYHLTEYVVDKEKMQSMMDLFDSIARKSTDELDEKEKAISAIVDSLMDIIAFLLKLVERMAEEIEKKSS